MKKCGYELFPKNGDQMWESYKKYSKICDVEYDDQIISNSIEETYKIAFDIIEDFQPDCSIKLPNFIVPEGISADEELERLCWARLKRKKIGQ